jgi:hypothetical protein
LQIKGDSNQKEKKNLVDGTWRLKTNEELDNLVTSVSLVRERTIPTERPRN